jgi:hypothetical protein
LVTAYNNETLYSSVGFADEYDDEEDWKSVGNQKGSCISRVDSNHFW